MLPRTLEPEVMDTAEEASDYDAMDHSEVNARFCEDLLAFAPQLQTVTSYVLDVGTGTARIPIELCRRAPRVEVEGIDLAEHMLAVARENVARAGLDDRITLMLADAKGTGRRGRTFEAVISNSIVHHIPNPADVFAEMWRLLRTGGAFFVRDLHRPDSAEEAQRLTDTYAPLPSAADHPADVIARHRRQRDLLLASLHAALTVDEVRELLAPLGVPASAVQKTSDRHWTVACLKR